MTDTAPPQKRAESPAIISHSPAQLFAMVVVSVMIIEIVVMFLLGSLPAMPRTVENLMGGVLLTLLILPALYLFMFRPMNQQIAALRVTEDSLRRRNRELEEKTAQLLAAQADLVRKERLAVLGQVADTVGHELRNPLGVMNNAVYFLQTVLADADETTREYLGIIRDEIADAERIVSDLLDAVRTKPPQPQAVDLAEAVVDMLRKCNVPPSVAIDLDLPPELPAIAVDPSHLHQVLRNLITNAVEAMPEGGRLDIRASVDEAGRRVRIGIADTGTGMTAEQQSRLFQPLFTTKSRRVGLGLAVVKNLTQANGGSVAVESAAGKGSTFTVVLPIDITDSKKNRGTEP